ncbi:hypothetical protein [Flavobacterium sp. HSC-61S13]|uniref:hypothetical protein n=1 Tax=Flavobacterium sp. HSC-61S13 TaxID=2910963 RepID=UPI0020A15396|nr:hypothetical protein [Flavobacterium sp. HSC-61S13]MCP1994749.1 hypothetical protein [Flavobacterium sp. HSC-61S13]
MKKIYYLILGLLLPFLLQAQYKINTVWGDGNTAITNQSTGSATSITQDTDGNFYLATAGSHVILKITPTQQKTVFAGTGIAGYSGDTGLANAATLNAPSSVTIQNNNLYIADQGNRRIRKVDLATNIITTVAGDGTENTTTNGLGGCVSVAVDSNQNIYVSTGQKNTIQKITATGIHTTYVGTGIAGFNIADNQAATAALNSPTALFIKDTDLYIADMGNRRIRKVNLNNGQLSNVAGDGTTNITGNGLGGCNGVTVDPLNNIYVSAGGKHVVRKITAGGVHTTYAGTGTKGFSGDNGSPELANLKGPSGLLYANSQLYFSDLGNYRIRSIKDFNFAPNSNKVLFVKKGSNGTGDSWNNAIGELSDALAWARDNASKNLWTAQNPLQIWVAAGTYFPQYKLTDLDLSNVPTTSRDQTFYIENNINLFGGFVGTENTVNDRIWNSNKTILSGDLLGNDLAESFDNHTENTYHVVTAVNSTFTMDGFTISGGNTGTTGAVAINTRNIFRTAGAGMHAVFSNVKLLDVVFEKNKGTGAAAYIKDSSFTFKNGKVRNNTATNIAGFSIDTSTVNIINSAIYNNTVSSLYAVLNSNASTTVITNTVITKNTSGGTTAFQGTMASSVPATQIYNSIIWDNTTGPGLDTSVNFIALNNITKNVLTGNWNVDPQFTNAANNDFSLKMASPARDKGNNIYYTTAGGNLQNDRDLGNFARLSEANIDLGAYELQIPLIPLAVTLNPTHIQCHGTLTGALTTTVVGGIAPYTYQWLDGSSTTATRSSLGSGSYTVIVTDAIGGTATTTITLTQPLSAMTTTGSFRPVSCNGGSNGTATVVVSGGISPYTYTWNNSSSTSDTATGLTVGFHTVTATDANGCQISRTFTITQPTVLNASTSQTNLACFNGVTGIASVTPTGGTAPYTYLWSNGASSQTISGLAAGQYSVEITDFNSCTVTKTIMLTQPTALAVTETHTNVSCNGGSNGSGTINVTGGTPPYSYSWAPVGGNLQTATGLRAGTYTVTITDSNSCTTTKSVSITEPEPLLVTESSTNINCYAAANGTAEVSVSGGRLPYSYQWSNGATTSKISNLNVGNYHVTISDGNGCTKTASFLIKQPLAPLEASSTLTMVSCSENNNGVAAVTPSGGTAPYTYLWNTGASTPSISNLTAGDYNVVITDASGCSITVNMTITQPSPLATSGSQVNISCAGAATGSANVSVSGGTGTYSYSWSPSGGTSANATELTAGNYTVTITDANNCQITRSFNITEPQTFDATSSQTNVSCNALSDGTATVTATGGTGIYTYSWYPTGGTAATATGLTAGNYTVTITDSNLCSITRSFTIEGSIPLTLLEKQVNVSCYGGSNGSATVTMTGGTTPYTYLWSNNATTPTATGLSAGTYEVEITDAKGCTRSTSFTITEPSLLIPSTTQTDIVCYGTATGTATVNSIGGTAPYTYLWSNGATTPTITDLTAATYTVIVTDYKGCTTSTSVDISQRSALTVTASQVDVSCLGEANGSATVLVSGGSPGYTYFWAPSGGSEATASNLAAGQYTVTITDANECTTVKEITIASYALTTVWNGTAWSNGSPNSLQYRAVFEADFNSTANLTACSISVENKAKVTIKSGHTLTVNHRVDIEVGADLIIEDKANLLQIENVANSGIATVISNSTPMKWLDYTLWSSPVSGQNVFGFSPETVKNRIFTYKGSVQLVNQSPIDNSTLSSSSTMEVGYGYLFRAPNTYYNSLPNALSYTGKFKGVLNNGPISVNTYAADFTSIGNPYPSALDLSAIVTDYNATAYFYTNSYPYVNGAYTGNNYASYNSTGSTSSGNGVIPTGIVQKGQGFILETLASTIEFNNSMRVNTAGAMMKPAFVERHRYWIDLKDDKTKELYNQILVGYLDGASSAFDHGKDAKLFGHEGTALYTLIDQDQTAYVIQGKGLPFTDTDKVALGFKAVEAGNFSVKINHVDGLFQQNQRIILLDKLLNTEHDLTLGDYAFSSESGVFNQRFEIVYASPKLAIDQPKDKEVSDWLAYKKGDVFQIESIGFDIQHIEVYDMLGKRLFKSTKIDAKNYVLPVINNQQILLIKLQTMGNQTLYKKVKN